MQPEFAYHCNEKDIRNQRNVHFGHLAGSSQRSQYWLVPSCWHVLSPIESHSEDGRHFFCTLVIVPRISLLTTVRQTSYRNTSTYSPNLTTVTADTRRWHSKYTFRHFVAGVIAVYGGGGSTQNLHPYWLTGKNSPDITVSSATWHIFCPINAPEMRLRSAEGAYIFSAPQITSC